MFHEKDIARYCRAVTKKCPRAYRKKLRETLSSSVEEYLETHPTADMQAFEAHFGTPQQCVEAFVDAMSNDEKQYYIQRSKILVFCAVAALAFFVAAVSITAIIIILDTHAARAGYVEVYITEPKEESTGENV